MTKVKLEELIEISLAAGREIMEVYAQSEVGTHQKGDGSPVTEADSRAEAVILRNLRAVAPGIPIVAEEEVAAGRIPATNETFFLVDPLDGTREFVNRNGEFTVNIALVVDGAPVMGVVYAPVLNSIYAGSEDSAVKIDVALGQPGATKAIRTRCPVPRGIVAVGSRSHGSDETATWLQRYEVASFLSQGSSLKFCLVAEGLADIYPRFGRTMEWDTAAGHAVLRAAGGTVTNIDGSTFTYNKRNQPTDSDFANPHFIAFGDVALAAGIDAVAVSA